METPSPRRRTGRRPRLRHWLEYLAYRAAVGVLCLIPERPALRFGECVGWVVGFVFRVRWRTVIRHLRMAFPEEDERWRRRIARASYRHMGRESVATFRLGRMPVDDLRLRMDMVGFEAVKEAAAAGKGLIVVTGHLGNWEIGGASIAVHGVPVEVLAQRQRNPLSDADLNANRKRLGMTVIERKDALRRVVRALKTGRAVGIVGDQNVRRGGVFVEFFGRPASTARGAALFALRARCPLFVGAVYRKPGFPQRYRLTFEPVEILLTGEVETDVACLTQAHTRRLEEWVREAPEQYFWQHRRWKTRPPGESVGPRDLPGTPGY